MSSLKFKEKTTDLDTRIHKYLLLALVKLIHADPKLMLHVSEDVYLSGFSVILCSSVHLMSLLCVGESESW